MTKSISDLAQVQERRHPRLSLASLVFLSGTIGTAVLWTTTVSLDDRIIEARCLLQGSERHSWVRSGIEDTLEELENLASFRAIHPGMTREEFEILAKPLCLRHPSIRAIGFNLLVTDAERVAHEQAVRKQGIPHYEITEEFTQGKLSRAERREFYVPVTYIEPLAGNEQALGFDTASEPIRSEALLLARDSGEQWSSARITLVQESKEGQYSVLVFQPVYKDGRIPETINDRRDRLFGYFVGVVRIEDVLKSAIGHLNTPSIGVQLFDDSAPSGERLLADTRISGSVTDSRFVFEDSILCGNRNWRLAIAPTTEHIAEMRSRAPWGVLLGGMIITALSSAHLSALRRRTVRINTLLLERERAEDNLRKSEARLRLTLDSITDGGWYWDLDQDTLELSERFMSSLGYHDPVEDHTSFFSSLVHPDDVERDRKSLEAHLRGDQPAYECELRVLTASGEYRWTSRRGRIVLRADNGTPLQMIGVDTNATRKRADEEKQKAIGEELQHTQRLESLGVLAGGIAHDFNNLLMVILGNAELATEGMRNGPDEKLADRLKHIETAGRYAAGLVSQMLAYAGKGPTQVEFLNLGEVFSQMSDLLESTISKKANLSLRFGDDLPTIEGDASQLRQVFMNLVANASDSLGSNEGTILAGAFVVHFNRTELDGMHLGSELKSGPYVVVEVTDTGMGMSPATCAHVFDPFFTTKFQGRGLG
ncbi:MAG: two-component system cell cycle sensor histidine kinase/response regulator CckA [Planctomycetota bacterium]|jgi:two-component system cell cycle sensor histidine kinase/response regulator CckA